MRRFVIGAVVAAVAALTLAGPAGAQVPPGEDSVTGLGAQAFPDCQGPLCFRSSFDYAARSGPAGEEPGGTVRYRLEFEDGSVLFDYAAPVTCLRVDGNEATIGIDISAYEPPSGIPMPGTAIVIWAVDGGPGGSDLYTFETLAEPAACDLPRERDLLPVAEGDIVVTDAPAPPPFPATAADCRDGGWRAFGFRSVGHCLVFVAKLKLCEALERRGLTPPFCPPRPPRR